MAPAFDERPAPRGRRPHKSDSASATRLACLDLYRRGLHGAVSARALSISPQAVSQQLRKEGHDPQARVRPWPKALRIKLLLGQGLGVMEIARRAGASAAYVRRVPAEVRDD